MKYYSIGSIVAIILIGIIIFSIYQKRNSTHKINAYQSTRTTNGSITFDEVPDLPKGFGYKTQWVAIKTTNTESVATELGLINLRKSNWKTGIEAANEGYYFVAPPVNGWTIVINSLMPDLGSEITSNQLSYPLKLISFLSKNFGEAYYFGNHRIVGYYSWAKAINGNIIRAFGYHGEAGSILVDQGILTPEEKKLSLNYNKISFDDDTKLPDEEDVISIAKEWSLDPKMEEGKYNIGIGIVGINKVN